MALDLKNLLTAQINSIFLPEQQIALEQLLYNAGKTLLDPKCYVNLKVEQADLDQHKSLSLIDINYNIPLADLEGLPDKPPLLKPFPTDCFSFEDFFQILSTR